MVISVVSCPSCKAPFGRVVEINNRPHLDDGFMLVLVGIRRCHCCGRVFHWHGDKIQLSEVVAQPGQIEPTQKVPLAISENLW